MTSIPASAIVSVVPSVLSAGGTALDLNGLALTTNALIPTNTTISFSSPSDVAGFFGPTSTEAATSAVYFGGFTGANALPGSLLFARYPTAATAAQIYSGSLASVTVSQMNAMTGTLAITIDGAAFTASSFTLTGVSQSAIAATIQTALNTTLPTEASCTTGSIAGTVFTPAGTVTGTFAVGQTLTGSSITSGSMITSAGTVGGTWNLAASSTVSDIVITATPTPVSVTWNSTSAKFILTSGTTGTISTVAYATGTLAAMIKLTSVAGATLSQGVAGTTPGAFMTSLVQNTTNWASFFTMFDPDGGSGNAQKLLFAQWTAQQNDRYAYVCWDTDITPTESNAATTSLGYLLAQENASGTILIYEPTDLNLAAFVSGAIASIDFTETNGRATLAFKGQSGLTASVTDQTVGANLIANGYNFYGSYATANDKFVFFYPGVISGPYLWADSYVNQIWLNNAFQLAMMTLLTAVKSVPYDAAGRTLIYASCQDVITAGLNFGAFSGGVTLSAAQAAEVNYAAGVKIDAILSTRGWYLQILAGTAQVRAARTSPPMTFWYTDAGSVQKLNLVSVEIQ
jgi:hypothetical protein